MEIDKPTPITCAVVAVDHTSLDCRVCSICGKTLPEGPTSSCKYWYFSNSSKRLFRLLMSIATDTEVVVVIMFDRAAKVLFGCSADEFFDFAKTHPYAAMAAGRALEGEMLNVTSVVPLRNDFEPAIVTLRELYQGRGVS